MIGKLKKGSSFGGCIRYVTGKDEAKILASDGVLLGTNAEMTQSFELQRQLNPRIKKPVGHIALSFKPEDKPRLTDEFMAKITLEAISVLAESDALHLGSLLVLIDKLQENTSLCKFILEFLPTISAFQGILDGIVNLVFGTLRIAQFASVSLTLVRSVSKSILGFKSLGHLLITPVIIPV
jgi:hypothetical protein